jgi:hypothetical protein
VVFLVENHEKILDFPGLSCGAELGEAGYVSLPSRPHAFCGPPRSTRNLGSFYTKCETALVALHLAPSFRADVRMALKPPMEFSNIKVAEP